MSKSSLSELCTICHSETPIYKCPRCKTQTCSLPCYKRHQQRASCSGKRDPARYLKKSQWATPAGMDQDYNYLKSVERMIDGSAQDAEERGIGSKIPSSKRAASAWVADSGFQKYLIRNQITVQHAPRGMSRQKTNQSRLTKRGNIMWTVEWMGSSGKGDVQTDCREDMSVERLYDARQREIRNIEKRTLAPSEPDGSQHGTKRKRSNHTGDRLDVSDAVLSVQEKGVFQSLYPGEVNEAGNTHLHDPVSLRENTTTLSTGPYEDANTEDHGDVETTAKNEDLDATVKIKAKKVAPNNARADLEDRASRSSTPVRSILEHDSPHETSATDLNQSTRSESDLPSKGMYFYLLKPATKSPARVLIPLSSKAKLTQSLEEQTVLEFPTIYVLQEPPDELPEGFLLEKEYRRMIRAERDAGNLSINGDEGPHLAASHHNHSKPGAPSEFDAQEILNMLKRDVTV